MTSRQHGQIAQVRAEHRVEELDADGTSVPEGRQVQTIRWKTSYVIRVTDIVDSTAVTHNHHKIAMSYHLIQSCYLKTALTSTISYRAEFTDALCFGK